jgi:hypothetical protein
MGPARKLLVAGCWLFATLRLRLRRDRNGCRLSVACDSTAWASGATAQATSNQEPGTSNMMATRERHGGFGERAPLNTTVAATYSRPPLFSNFEGRDLVFPVTPRSELSNVPHATDHGRTGDPAQRAGDDRSLGEASRLPRTDCTRHESPDAGVARHVASHPHPSGAD